VQSHVRLGGSFPENPQILVGAKELCLYTYTFLEYITGLNLSSLFKLPTLNHLPHATALSKCYKIMITLLQKYD